MRSKLQNGEVLTGQWVQSGSPVVAEIMADGGLDFVVADMEHGEFDDVTFCNFCRALSGKAAAFARVRENDTIMIRRALDCGADGIIVPLVNTAQDAARAVAATRYPPQGERGFAFCRANQWGRGFDSYVENNNGRVVLVVMIETSEAVDAIDEILQVPGVDGVLVGPYDMSGSFGIPGQLEHPYVKRAKERVLNACLRHKKAAGQHIVQPTLQNVTVALQEGYTFLPLGMDTVFISSGVDGLCEMMKSTSVSTKAKL